MLKQSVVAFVIGTLTLGAGCSTESTSTSDVDAVLAKARRLDDFVATVSMLEARGQAPDLTAAALELVVEDGQQVQLLRMPITGTDADELTVRFAGETPEVLVHEAVLADDKGEPNSSWGPCGPFQWASSCTAGPYGSGLYCSNGGPLYAYHRYTRKHYANGRKVFYETTWYSCSWIGQPSISTCNNTCY